MSYNVLINRDRWDAPISGWSTIVSTLTTGTAYIVEIPTWARWARVRLSESDKVTAHIVGASARLLDSIDVANKPPLVQATPFHDAEIPLASGGFVVANFSAVDVIVSIELFATDACPWNR